MIKAYRRTSFRYDFIRENHEKEINFSFKFVSQEGKDKKKPHFKGLNLHFEFFNINCVYLTYSIQYNLKPLKDIKNTELFWYLTYIQFFLVGFGVFLIFSLIKYLMYNKKLKACVKLIKMRSRESKNQ